MRRELVIGFVVTLGILILIGLLVTPTGAVLGLLLLLTAAMVVVWGSHVIFVRERTTAIVCSRQHNAVIRAVPGPATTFLLPFKETVGMVLDTDYRKEEVEVANVLLHDQQPTALGFTARVMYQLAPHTLSPEQLGRLLPTLTDNVSGVVQLWTDYYLRILVGATLPGHIQDLRRSRLERCLKGLLSDRLVELGIVVQELQLLIRPPIGLLDTLTGAEQQRVINELHVELLAAMLDALTEKSEQTRSLAVLELAKSFARNNQTWTTFDWTKLLSEVGFRSSEPLSTGSAQLALWPELTEHVRQS